MKNRLILLSYLIFSNSIYASNIIVSKYGEIKNLEAAINLANDGDLIIIKNGVYINTCVTIDKSVEIKGEGYPVLDGNHVGTVIEITANNVKISGVIVKNSAASYFIDYAGIKLLSVHHCEISGIKMYDNFFSFHCLHCVNCYIHDNYIQSNFTKESYSGNGVHMWTCDSMYVANNTIVQQRDGIYLEFTRNSVIINNSCSYNLRYGLHFMFSNNDSYIGNTFFNNGSGVAVMYSHHILMKKNSFHDNWSTSSYGLLLKEITDSRLEANIFEYNTTGINLEGANRINISYNQFSDNGYAIRILGDCNGDTIHRNDFTDNSFDVCTNTNTSGKNNVLEGNYWDRYNGYDLNRDSVGDVPYRPVSLFSMMVESNPNSSILLGSFIVNILDAIEKIMPSFIPESLIDNIPRMHPNCRTSQYNERNYPD